MSEAKRMNPLLVLVLFLAGGPLRAPRADGRAEGPRVRPKVLFSCEFPGIIPRLRTLFPPLCPQHLVDVDEQGHKV
jgi:hypothetical protein